MWYRAIDLFESSLRRASVWEYIIIYHLHLLDVLRTSYNQYHSSRNDVFKVKLPLHYLWYYSNEYKHIKDINVVWNI